MTFKNFERRKLKLDKVTINYQIGGKGKPLVLLHGWPQHSLMWHTVAPILAKSFTVIVPDMRGAGGSSIPVNGYDKKTMADDIYQVIVSLEYEQCFVAGYDLGSGVAFNLAARHPDVVQKVAVMEFGLPGYGYEQMMSPSPDWHAGSNWHLGFFTVPQVAEWAFTGKERELLTWFLWHISHDESATPREHFNIYVDLMKRPGALRAGIEYYANVWKDAEDNKQIVNDNGKLQLPLLAIGGQSSSSHHVGNLFEAVAENVTTAVIPDAGHWLGDENPEELAETLKLFFEDN